MKAATFGSGGSLVRSLTAKDGFAIVVGSVIGSGIFLVPGPIASQLPALRDVLLVWICGALLSLFGALSLAEMGAMFPGAGGLYVYLRRAYGAPVSFLYGWGLLTMIHTGSIATLGAGFGLYLSHFAHLTVLEQRLAGVACVLTLTGLNLLGLKAGKLIQNVSTAAKIAGIVTLGALLFSRGHVSSLRASWSSPGHAAPWAAMGVALIAVLWGYEGWHVVSFTAGEFRNPKRDLPRSLIFGTIVIGAIYIALNIGYYAVLSTAAIRGSASAASAAVTAAWGDSAASFVSVLILLSIFGAMNGMIFTGPRVYYAMARDGDFLPIIGRVDTRFHAPTLAILIQGVWASVLILLGSFQQLFTDVVFTAWIFYGLAVFAVIPLRRKLPALERPFRTPGYPVVPLLFVLAAFVVVVSAIASQPFNSLVGFGLILVGIPVYLVFHFQHARTQPAAAWAEEAGE